jgi:hypothetical protein
MELENVDVEDDDDTAAADDDDDDNDKLSFFNAKVTCRVDSFWML